MFHWISVQVAQQSVGQGVGGLAQEDLENKEIRERDGRTERCLGERHRDAGRVPLKV